jgi:hypothetical protein
VIKEKITMQDETPVKRRTKPRVLIDADVLFAGSAAPTEFGASHVVLRMAEITLVEAYTCQQVIDEAERNLAAKMPGTLPAFRLIVDRCLHVVPNPTPIEVQSFLGLANPVDLPILATSILHDCPWMVTFNTMHYKPGHDLVVVLTPGDFLLRVRNRLASLG